MGYGSPSPSTVVGIVAVAIAIIGSQFLEWEWGSGQLAPTLVGVAVVGVVALLFVRERLS